MPFPLRMNQKNGMILPACQKNFFDNLVDGGASYPQFAMVVLLRLAACSVPASQFSMVAPHRSQAHSRCSLLHWAHRRLLQPLAAPPLSPSLGLLRAVSPTGRALRAPLAPPAASRPPIVHCASLRVLATSALRASDVRKLTRGFLCLTGLTTACFRHWRRPSCAPFPFGKKEALGQGYFIR